MAKYESCESFFRKLKKCYAEVKLQLALGESIIEPENGEIAPFVCPDASAISIQLPDIHGFFSHDNSLLW